MNKSVYNIDEERLKQQFTAFKVDFNEQYWVDFEGKLSNVKVQSTISFKKISLVFIIVPIALVVLGGSAYYYFNNIATSEKVITPEVIITNIETKTIPTAPIKIVPPPQKSIVTTVTAVIDSSSLKKQLATAKESVDSSKSNVSKKEQIQKVEKTHNDTNNIKEKHSDTNDSLTKQSSEHHESTHKKKKKKKKKGIQESIESIKSKSLVPSNSEDDIVVPN